MMRMRRRGLFQIRRYFPCHGINTLARLPPFVRPISHSPNSLPQLSTDLIKIMEQRLSAIEHRSGYLQELINQPTTSASEYSRANKELRKLGNCMDLVKELRAKQKEIDDLNSLLSECSEDKEMQDMATEEYFKAMEEEKRLQHLLLNSLLPKDDADDRDCILEELEVKKHPYLQWIYLKCMRNIHKRKDGSLML